MRIDINEIRKQLDLEIKDNGPAKEREGLILIEKRDPRLDHRKGIQCLTYLQQKTTLDLLHFWMHATNLCYPEEVARTENPQKGDIAIYLIEGTPLDEAAHIGQVIENGMIRSKWGYGQVYEHKVDLVPAAYGTKVVFFRRK